MSLCWARLITSWLQLCTEHTDVRLISIWTFHSKKKKKKKKANEHISQSISLKTAETTNYFVGGVYLVLGSITGQIWILLTYFSPATLYHFNRYCYLKDNVLDFHPEAVDSSPDRQTDVIKVKGREVKWMKPPSLPQNILLSLPPLSFWRPSIKVIWYSPVIMSLLLLHRWSRR